MCLKYGLNKTLKGFFFFFKGLEQRHQHVRGGDTWFEKQLMIYKLEI